MDLYHNEQMSLVTTVRVFSYTQISGATANIPPRSFPLLHEGVLDNFLIKVHQMSRMTPRLDSLLFLDSSREERAPLQARVRLINLSARQIVDQLSKVLDMRVESSIVVSSGQLDQLANVSDRTINSHILMANDSFSCGFGLISGCAKLLEDVESFDAPVDVEGHPRGGEVFFGSAEVV